MAGYIIYSLDWEKFQEFVERPTSSQLSALEELLADGFEEYDGGFEEGDPVLGWADEPGGLAQVAARRLVLPDWYGDLSATGRDLWEGVVFGACSDREDIDVGFRVDSDGVYWDVIELAWKESAWCRDRSQAWPSQPSANARIVIIRRLGRRPGWSTTRRRRRGAQA